ncbi:hypothetical protein ACMDCR_00645 [Labrys okinawensis]|uniref:hypothetical protein n=1 Tax=Labrys okinawensis TaxID=346911 RepID=UPI0039BD8D65
MELNGHFAPVAFSREMTALELATRRALTPRNPVPICAPQVSNSFAILFQFATY